MHRALYLILTVVGLCLNGPAFAAGAWETDPEVYKIRLENPKVRVLDVTYSPKTKVQSHSLRERLVLTQSDARIKTTDASGRMKELSVLSGQTSWEPAETVEIENIGESDYRATYIEIK